MYSFFKKAALPAVVTLLSFFTGRVYAQGSIGNVPLSRFGVGELMPEGGVRSYGMGGTAMALPSADFVNLSNPALLIFSRSANFEAGVNIIRRNLTDSSGGSAFSAGGGVAFASFTFPIAKRMVVNASFRPYSYTNYSVSNSSYGKYYDPVTNSYKTDTTKFGQSLSATGGLSRAALATGYTIAPGLGLGFQASYIFGTLENYNTYSVSTLGSEIVDLHTTTRVNNLMLKPALFLRLYNDTVKNIQINLGASYEFSRSLGSNRSQYVEYRIVSGSILTTDTVNPYNEAGSVNIPATVKAGIGFQKLLHWSAGLDFTTADWSKFNTGFANYGSTDMGRTLGISAGGEWLPNYASTKIYKRIMYRLGANYQKLPQIVNGNQLTDMSLSLGFSVPIVRKDS